MTALQEKVAKRVRIFTKLKSCLNKNTPEWVKPSYGILIDNFYRHHGNLCMYAVHKRLPNVLSSIVTLPEFTTRTVFWKEIRKVDDKYIEEEKSGTIKNYIELYKSDLEEAEYNKYLELLQNVPLSESKE